MVIRGLQGRGLQRVEEPLVVEGQPREAVRDGGLGIYIYVYVHVCVCIYIYIYIYNYI